MRYTLPILTACLTLIGCNRNPASRVNEADLKTYTMVSLMEFDSTLALESFDLLSVDTISLKNQYTRLYYAMDAKSVENQAEIKRLLASSKSHTVQMQLLKGISDDLVSIYADDARKELASVREILVKDSLLMIDRQEVLKLLNKADSAHPVAYSAKCPISYRKKDRSLSKDTMYIALDTDFNILNKNDYNKRLNNLHKMSSGFTIE